VQVVRRFEYVQGNQAKFWEIARRGAQLTIGSGRIGGSKKERNKEFMDYMAAEQEFDRLIRDKLRRGYVEVHAASEPEGPASDRSLRLRSLDGARTLDLKAAATRYVTWRMVEVGAMDKQLPAPDLDRWTHRASRRLRLEENPNPGDAQYGDFRGLFLELSRGDRSAETGQHGVVGAYKLLSGSDWELTAKECGWLADATKNRTPRRHKITANQEQWLGEWTEFLEYCAKHDGCVVELVSER
jgi:predicted DNA-binding WGR domain protein